MLASLLKDLLHQGLQLLRYLHNCSIWADSPVDEKRVWEGFLGILSDADRPTLLHYGSFEKTFLKKMCERYGGPPEHSAAAIAIEYFSHSSHSISLLVD